MDFEEIFLRMDLVCVFDLGDCGLNALDYVDNDGLNVEDGLFRLCGFCIFRLCGIFGFGFLLMCLIQLLCILNSLFLPFFIFPDSSGARRFSAAE